MIQITASEARHLSADQIAEALDAGRLECLEGFFEPPEKNNKEEDNEPKES